jgi:hypothetical protein
MPTIPLEHDVVFKQTYGARVEQLVHSYFNQGHQQGFSLAVQAMLELKNQGQDITPEAIISQANKMLSQATSG